MEQGTGVIGGFLSPVYERGRAVEQAIDIFFDS